MPRKMRKTVGRIRMRKRERNNRENRAKLEKKKRLKTRIKGKRNSGKIFD